MPAYYRLWRTSMRVSIASVEVAAVLDRLCHQFATAGAPSAAQAVAEFEVRRGAGDDWEILEDGKVVGTRDSPLRAARHLEWRMVQRVSVGEREFLHWHAAALTRNGRTVLIPGTAGIGKSTLSLVLANQGFELLGDDVVFMAPTNGVIHPFHRAPHVLNDAIPRLQAAGFPYNPALHLPGHFEVEAVSAWRQTPSPPLSHVLRVDWDEEGPVEILPITQAEAAVEMQPFSHTLKGRADGGWSVLQRVLAPTKCYRVLRSQDLLSAVEAIRSLVDRDPPAASR